MVGGKSELMITFTERIKPPSSDGRQEHEDWQANWLGAVPNSGSSRGVKIELDEVVGTEPHSLYVAAPRARDHLFLSGVEPYSEFLKDLI